MPIVLPSSESNPGTSGRSLGLIAARGSRNLIVATNLRLLMISSRAFTNSIYGKHFQLQTREALAEKLRRFYVARLGRWRGPDYLTCKIFHFKWYCRISSRTSGLKQAEASRVFRPR